MIETLAALIPASMANKSGKAFYSGRAAFSQPNELYILGANPGGDPKSNPETVERHTRMVLQEMPDLWSAYRDETWRRGPAEESPLGKRILHLLAEIGFEPRRVPASNVCFARSRRISEMDFDRHAEDCWPFHRSVIENIRPQVIVCLGKKAAKFVREKLDANIEIDRFVERNERRWKSAVFRNDSGLHVAEFTHPSIADWTSPKTDPSNLARRILSYSRSL